MELDLWTMELGLDTMELELWELELWELEQWYYGTMELELGTME